MAIKDISSLKQTDFDSKFYDICIIGSGPAGITLCAELATKRIKVCVLERGSFENTQGRQRNTLYSNGDILIKETSRVYAVGGTSTVWAGLSAPLDKIDFTAREFLVPGSLWPFSQEELKPYYERAERYGFSPFGAFYPKENNPRSSFLKTSPLLIEKIFRAPDPAWNFGEKFLSIFESNDIDLYTNARVSSLSSREDGDIEIIEGARISDLNKQILEVRAKIFVIATGGIETSRLLLESRDVSLSGIGNKYDVVGRYIMNHPKNNFGIIALRHPLSDISHFWGYLERGWAGYAGIRLDEVYQREQKILNSYIRLEPIFPWTDNLGVELFLSFVKKFKRTLTWLKNKKTKIVLLDWNEAESKIENIKRPLIKNLICIIRDLPKILLYLNHRILIKKISTKRLRIRNFMEMEPRAENRITLTKKNDGSGASIPMIKLEISPLDKKSLIAIHKIIETGLKDTGLGALLGNIELSNPWPINADASHHLGGARMGVDPEISVVDANLQIHNTKNLYVVGGAVFPTSGCANPTYTICALSIRLADFLKTKI